MSHDAIHSEQHAAPRSALLATLVNIRHRKRPDKRAVHLYQHSTSTKRDTSAACVFGLWQKKRRAQCASGSCLPRALKQRRPSASYAQAPCRLSTGRRATDAPGVPAIAVGARRLWQRTTQQSQPETSSGSATRRAQAGRARTQRGASDPSPPCRGARSARRRAPPPRDRAR
jgi:hypothetical protein